MAALTEVSLDLIGSDVAGDELAEAEAMASALEPAEQADVREMRRSWVHAAAAPKDLQTAKARIAAQLQTIWARAKPENDFRAFAGPFSELLEIVRDIAHAQA